MYFRTVRDETVGRKVQFPLGVKNGEKIACFLFIKENLLLGGPGFS